MGAWNVLDIVMVVSWWFGKLVDVASFVNPYVFRLVRMVRLVRMCRLFKAVKSFDSLHILFGSLTHSFSALFWCTCFLVFIQLVASLAMTTVIIKYIQDDSAPLDKRLQTYKYFGTFTR